MYSTEIKKKYITFPTVISLFGSDAKNCFVSYFALIHFSFSSLFYNYFKLNMKKIEEDCIADDVELKKR
jgi:hypothetical protein